MFETSAYRTIKNLASKFPIILITGMRGCDVATLSRRLMPTKSFIDLGDDGVFTLAKQSSKTFLLAFPDGAIINSVQRIPDMLEAMRYHVGRWGFKPGKFIAISSCSLDYDESDDRVACFNASGLTVDDMQGMKMPVSNPFRLMQTGQLPQVLEGKRNLDDIEDEILTKDIRQHINISNLELFRFFMKVCAALSAKQLSVNMIAKQTDISAPTAKSWLKVLQRNLLIRTVTAKDNPLHSTIFFSDTGILCALLGIEGPEQLILSPHRERVARTFAFNELLRGRFSKGLDPELECGIGCDFHANWKGGLDLVLDPSIEVTQSKMQQALQISRSNAKKVVMLYLGDVTYTKDGLDCISFRDWTKLAMEIDYFS